MRCQKSKAAISAVTDGQGRRCRQGGEYRTRLPCFQCSERCYRYEGSLSADNAESADLLTALTENRKRWGFGLCFDYLRNIKSLPWNKKQV